MLRMRIASNAAHAQGKYQLRKARFCKKPNAGDGEAVPLEVPRPEILAQLLATVESLQDTVNVQQREIEAQKDLVARQREDTTKLHVDSYVHKTHQRELEMKAEMEKYSNPHIKR